jgi:hypothetical protein
VAAWAQLADTLSNQPWILHIGVRLAPAGMMTVSTIAQISYLIFTRMRDVVVPAAAPFRACPGFDSDRLS